MPLQDMVASYPARWWHRARPGLQCTLCPRRCVIAQGQHGFCFLRQNIDGEIKTFHGSLTGIAHDPIEKKPLYHFYPGENILSIGSLGCNLACAFCQNWEISQSQHSGLFSRHIAPEDLLYLVKQQNTHMVAFTYNEPVISAEFVIDAARVCRTHSIKTVAVTSGYISKSAREEFFEYIDAVNIDLKAFTERFYQQYCHAHLLPVLETLEYLVRRTHVWVEITNLLIPGYNDSDRELTAMCRWIFHHLGPQIPVHFSAFYPAHHFLHCKPTSPTGIRHARRMGIEAGLKYVYSGNINDRESTTTFCDHCRRPIIERHGYQIRSFHLVQGRCRFCQTLCKGHFR